MALNIRNPEADRLADRLAKATGETKTDAVINALKDRLERVQQARRGASLADELDEVALRCAALPVLDGRSADEILGYDDAGLPD
jgi:antitoxin VapB